MSEHQGRHDEPERWATLNEDGQAKPSPGVIPRTEGVVGVNVEHDMTIGGGSEPVGESVERGPRPHALSPVPVLLVILAILILVMAVVLGVQTFG